MLSALNLCPIADKILICPLKAKTLPELVQPVEKRIEDVKEFLNSIDKNLIFEVVPIADPFGPTKTDPNLDVSNLLLFSFDVILTSHPFHS